jgi:folate-dependent tRNA-U54 methylase TrmFO/GidA
VTADESRRDYELNAVLTSVRVLQQEVAYWKGRFEAEERTSSGLRRDRDNWKDRYEAAVQAHEADIKHFNRVYSCGAQQ